MITSHLVLIFNSAVGAALETLKENCHNVKIAKRLNKKPLMVSYHCFHYLLNLIFLTALLSHPVYNKSNVTIVMQLQ